VFGVAQALEEVSSKQYEILRLLAKSSDISDESMGELEEAQKKIGEKKESVSWGLIPLWYPIGGVSVNPVPIPHPTGVVSINPVPLPHPRVQTFQA